MNVLLRNGPYASSRLTEGPLFSGSENFRTDEKQATGNHSHKSKSKCIMTRLTSFCIHSPSGHLAARTEVQALGCSEHGRSSAFIISRGPHGNLRIRCDYPFPKHEETGAQGGGMSF